MLSVLFYVAFCALCSVLAFVRHPIWGMYFYLATIFVHPPSRWWGYMLPDLRWALLSALVTALAIAFHRGRLATKPLWLASGPAVLLTTYAVWMWIQTPWALDPDEHLRGSVQFTKYLVAYWFVYRLADTKEGIRNMLFALVLGCGILGLIAMGTGRVGGRLDGVGGPGMDDANTLGMVLATGAMAGFVLLLTQRGRMRWVVLAALGLIGQGFVLANSRGAFLGLAVGGLMIALTKAREHRQRFWVIAAIALVGFAIVVDKTFVERMFTIGDVTAESEEADMSARSRKAILEAQLQMALDYPAGVGFRGTVPISPKYLDEQWLAKLAEGGDQEAGRSSHNTFMTAWVEQGIPGAVIFLSLVLWGLLAGLRLRRMNDAGGDVELVTLGSGAFGALGVVLVAGLATDYLMAEVQFWLLAALVSVLQIGVGPSRQSVRPTAGAHSVPGTSLIESQSSAR
ncbi:O-antigen ligase family protein [uncultured Piscinibacter sp.]|uniref:O-antigen ligase family protein n=1 Tax=uncultured Piscinibacter sp. TaxID=1131835 RepID=UPI002634D9C6|nr:O-antigen ligase family protein [uncultured Piscinibacter sp.]